MSRILTVLALLLALPAEAGILRYTYRAKDSSADPTARIPQLIIADTEAECPSSDVGDGDICYATDTDDMQVRTNGAWADMYPQAGGTGDSTRVEDGNDAGTYTDATDADFSDQGDINFALDTATTPDQITATVRADSVALTTDTTGNYAAGDAEAGAALTGDSATAFFSSGTIEDARIDGSAEADELTLVGDVDGAANANDIDEASVEAELEGVIDLPDLQGTLDVASGGTGAAPGADDQVLVSDSVSGATWRGLSDCNTENMLTYSTATNTFGCEADDGGAGSGLDHPKVMMRLSYGGF